MTSGDARILFDECIPLPSFQRLVGLLDPEKLLGVTLKHLFEIAPPGTFDEGWIPGLKGQGWTVISADGGRQPNKGRGKKLPLLCAEYGVTLILLSPSVHRRKAVDKNRTILSVWDRIVEIAADPSASGQRFAIEPLNSGDLGIGRIVEKKPPRQPPKVD